MSRAKHSSISGVLFATDVEVDRGEVAPTTLEFVYKSASIDSGAADTTPVDGLTIDTNGDWTFDPSHPSYENLAAGQTQTIEVTYEVTDADNATATNSFTITVNGTNDDPVATFTTAQTSTEDAAVVTGQLTATDVDTGDVLKYFSVGAPVDGLNIVEDTGVWTFDPTDESYQYLKQGQILDITVEYAVEDQDGGFNESSFVITLTGTNDAPAVTGILSSLPGGSEDTLYTITKDQLLAGFSDKDTGETATLDIANLVTKDADGNVIGTLTAQDVDGNASDSDGFNGTDFAMELSASRAL